MWGWADPLVEKATRSIYTRVFTVFGVVTLAIVGLYLLWRSRQAHMSAAMTTAGWALLVMVAVTALATWPVFSAHLADNALVSSLAVVHDAVGPPAKDIPAGPVPIAEPGRLPRHATAGRPGQRHGGGDHAVPELAARVAWFSGQRDRQEVRASALRGALLTWDETERSGAIPRLERQIIQHKSADSG